MSRRQYLILLALSIPLVTTLDLPGVLRALVSTPTVGFADIVPTLPAAPIVDRVAMLANEPFTDLKELRRSDAFPDVELIDQYGKPHLFRSELVRDRIVCVLFFYAECKGTCPGTIQMVSELRKAISDEFSQQAVRFVAITLDPEHDTPEVLKAYADARGISPDDGMSDWLFCTGKYDDLELIRRSLGLYDLDPLVDADRSQHAALVTIGNDRTDRWTAQPSGLGSDDLTETFMRIAGTSERQRFAIRIGRSAEFMQTSASATLSRDCCADTLNKCNRPCCAKPSECCSLPDTNP